MYLRSFHPVIIRNEFAEDIFISCLSITAYHNCERSSPGAQKHLCHISRTGLRLYNFFQFSTPLMKRWVLSSNSCALFHNWSGKMLRSSVIRYGKFNFGSGYLLNEGDFEYGHQNEKLLSQSNKTFLFEEFFDIFTLKFLQ